MESIPPGRGRWQISTEGGDWPEWRRDGKELFFRQGTKIMAVPMRLNETSVEAGEPQVLFDVPADTRFQVSRDGQRFLIAMLVEGAAAPAALTVDTEWRAGLPTALAHKETKPGTASSSSAMVKTTRSHLGRRTMQP